jgi:hypothetical protein
LTAFYVHPQNRRRWTDTFTSTSRDFGSKGPSLRISLIFTFSINFAALSMMEAHICQDLIQIIGREFLDAVHSLYRLAVWA